ncbi:lipopolysaccharide assembly protein LapA domain-containing protein [Vibrio sp. S4M6]|uniref:LapA family protein n=1 Tax=Vibrio sinus TaxID=2946865 RepID=UPI00202A78F4|nr:lipopolysaccharide assembly protein LapA domain-containing protein [Vibrio sinus]MCL9783038.1 lipopolysaccharide assembly protein LapA domain-containing protein [Vibrio sinus]
MRIIKIIIVVALFLIALALGAQNQSIVTFNYLIAQGEFHLSALLGIVFVIGFLVSLLIFGSLHLKSKLQVRKLNRQLKKLNATQTAQDQHNKKSVETKASV